MNAVPAPSGGQAHVMPHPLIDACTAVASLLGPGARGVPLADLYSIIPALIFQLKILDVISLLTHILQE